MNIKIDLEDNKLCKGCPANCYKKTTCAVGHSRTIAVLYDNKDYNNQPHLTWEFARPITCFMQSDQLEEIPETNAKPISKPIGQVIALPYLPPEVRKEDSNDVLP